MKALLVLSALLLAPAMVSGGIHTEEVDYKLGDTNLVGYLAYKDDSSRKRPGVLVVHDWWGLKKFYHGIAQKLAEQGYVAFALDIYGKGVRPGSFDEAAETAGKYKKDRDLMRKRALAGLEELKKNKYVDPNRIAVIGYCFGGTVALELARSGAPIKGAVSFHGNLDTPNPADAKNIKAKVLVLHGADDPVVPPKEVAAFQEEMRKAGVDWYMVFYGDAVHAFTKPAAGKDKSKGVAYNRNADTRSWRAMSTFFDEIFGKPDKAQ